MTAQRYEYKFVRLGSHWWRRGAELATYQSVVHDHAREGWRLVQIFSPGVGVYGSATYWELIFEREVSR